MKYTLIKGKGGLGNRMLSAITGIVFSELSGRTPLIDWTDGAYAAPGANGYDALFKSALEPISVLPSQADVSPPLWRGRLLDPVAQIVENELDGKHSDPFLYRRISHDLKVLDAPEDVTVYWSYTSKLRRLRKAMKAQKHPLARMSDRAILSAMLQKYFAPHEGITDNVEGFFKALPRPILGVHIRYTDRKTPLDRFDKAIQAALKHTDFPTILLASDNKIVQERFSAQYPQIVYLDKWLPEDGKRLHYHAENNQVQAASEALRDMLALSRCDHLIYPGGSTFSYVSSLYGGLEGDALTDTERYDLKVRLGLLARQYI